MENLKTNQWGQTRLIFRKMPNIALKPTRFRYAPAVGLALR